jgi:hypothetical protein
VTVTFPDGVSSQGNASLWYLPAIVNITGTPKVLVSEFGAATAVNLSGMIYGFTINVDQGTADDIRYGSTQTFEIPGRVKLTGDTLDYVYDPQAPTSATYGAYKNLKLNVSGYLVDRRGVDVNTAAAATQIVDVYPVKFGNQTRKAIDPSAEGVKFQISQRFFITGQAIYDVPVAVS